MKRFSRREKPSTPQWPVDGTTGYDFLNVLSGLFVDPNGKRPLTDFYHEFTGQTAGYEEVVRAKKMHVLKHLFISELAHLTDLLEGIHRRPGRTVGWCGARTMEQALAELIAGFSRLSDLHPSGQRAGRGS